MSRCKSSFERQANGPSVVTQRYPLVTSSLYLSATAAEVDKMAAAAMPRIVRTLMSIRERFLRELVYDQDCHRRSSVPYLRLFLLRVALRSSIRRDRNSQTYLAIATTMRNRQRLDREMNASIRVTYFRPLHEKCGIDVTCLVNGEFR